jgi:hypothetical protein
MPRRGLIAAFATTAALAIPAGALAFGPVVDEDSPSVANCVAAFERQAAGGVTAGGGPKAGEPGPLNCDHFFQGVTETIGNGWPPPPFQE